MKDPFRLLLIGIFGITFDRTTEICLSLFDKPVHCPASEKELKLLESDSLWLARFDRKFLGYSHIWSTPRIINAIFGHYACFWDSQTEARGSRLAARKQRLAARGSRLAARGSRLGLAGSQNSLPQLLMSLRKIQSNHITFIFIALIDPLFLTMLIGQKTIITI